MVWNTKNTDTWFLSTLNAAWDDELTLWDDALVTWDAINAGGEWLTKLIAGWYTENS